MKKFLSIVGGLFLILAIVLAAVFGYFAFQRQGLDASSKAYVEESVPAVVSTWSKDQLLKRSAPELLKIANEKPEDMAQLFQMLSKLGAIKSFDDAKGGATVSYSQKNGKATTAAYTVGARFENGEGQINIQLTQSPAGQWEIMGFRVDSPLFLH